MKSLNGIRQFISTGMLIVAAVAALAPVFYMVFVAFRGQAELLQLSWSLGRMLEGWTVVNFGDVVHRTEFVRRALISLRNCLGVVVTSATLGLPAAYCLSRWPTARRLRASFSFLSVRMLPAIAVCVPVFWMFSQQWLVSSTTSYLVLQVGLNVPVVVWLAVPVFAAIPRELEELIVMDGLPRWKALSLVIGPLYARGLLGVALIVGLLVWNETFFAALFRIETVTEVIPSLIAHRGVQWGPIMALGTLVTIPGFLLFMIFIATGWGRTRSEVGR